MRQPERGTGLRLPRQHPACPHVTLLAGDPRFCGTCLLPQPPPAGFRHGSTTCLGAGAQAAAQVLGRHPHPARSAAPQQLAGWALVAPPHRLPPPLSVHPPRQHSARLRRHSARLRQRSARLREQVTTSCWHGVVLQQPPCRRNCLPPPPLPHTHPQTQLVGNLSSSQLPAVGLCFAIAMAGPLTKTVCHPWQDLGLWGHRRSVQQTPQPAHLVQQVGTWRRVVAWKGCQ